MWLLIQASTTRATGVQVATMGNVAQWTERAEVSLLVLDQWPEVSEVGGLIPFIPHLGRQRWFRSPRGVRLTGHSYPTLTQ